MTAQEIRELPALLTRSQVIRLTGWSKRKFYDCREKNPQIFVRLTGYMHPRVSTQSLLAILRIS